MDLDQALYANHAAHEYNDNDGVLGVDTLMNMEELGVSLADVEALAHELNAHDD